MILLVYLFEINIFRYVKKKKKIPHNNNRESRKKITKYGDK